MSLTEKTEFPFFEFPIFRYCLVVLWARRLPQHAPPTWQTTAQVGAPADLSENCTCASPAILVIQTVGNLPQLCQNLRVKYTQVQLLRSFWNTPNHNREIAENMTQPAHLSAVLCPTGKKLLTIPKLIDT